MVEAVVDPPVAPASPAVPAATAAAPVPETQAAPPVGPKSEPAQPPVVYDFKGADGKAADPEYAKQLGTLAAELKVDPKDGGKLYQHVQSRIDALHKQGETAWAAKLSEAEKVSRADPLIGGNDYDAKTASFKLMVEKFQHKDFPLWADIETLGFDRSPGLRYFLRNLFEGQREPNTIITGATGATITEAERLARDYPATAAAAAKANGS